MSVGAWPQNASPPPTFLPILKALSFLTPLCSFFQQEADPTSLLYRNWPCLSQKVREGRKLYWLLFVASIKHYNKEQLAKESVYIVLQFQGDKVCHGGGSMTARSRHGSWKGTLKAHVVKCEHEVESEFESQALNLWQGCTS